MIVFEFAFIADGYHATPWGRHVNEGAVEWPPSPWRILRALLAVRHLKSPHIGMELMAQICETLADPPDYYLPPVAEAHTRHYMPKWNSAIDGKTDKVFDAFYRIDRFSRMYVSWPDAEPTLEEAEAMAELLTRLGYLGRAESWVRARLLDNRPCEPNCRPLGGNYAGDGVVSRLLTPLPRSDYQAWRESMLQEQLTTVLARKKGKSVLKGKDSANEKLTPKEIDKIQQGLPFDIVACLQMETNDLRAAGWSRQPGTRHVEYLLPPDWREDIRIRHGRENSQRPTVARFALSSDTVGGDLRPQITKGLYLAETTRQALMSKSRDESGLPSPIFSGKHADGWPLSNHSHAYFLPVDEDRDGRIDHILLYTRQGFGREEIEAMSRIRRLWQYKNSPDLFPILINLGFPRDFKNMLRLLGPSASWVSATPFMLTRYPKRNGRDAPESQVRLEIQHHGLPEPRTVDIYSGGVATRKKTFRWSDFHRLRINGGGRPATMTGYGFRISFPEPIYGPVALGYGAHFGLGLFVPEEAGHDTGNGG